MWMRTRGGGHGCSVVSGRVVCTTRLALALAVLLLMLFTCEQGRADDDFAKAIRQNLHGKSQQRDDMGAQADTSHALTYVEASSHPLSVSQNTFKNMYKDNADLWSDCEEEDAYINYMRSQSGNVDSARLLMEFSMVPSIKSTKDSDIHAIAARGLQHTCTCLRTCMCVLRVCVL